eukprot:1155951-Pelagomonas_calceolata.AAC.1
MSRRERSCGRSPAITASVMTPTVLASSVPSLHGHQQHSKQYRHVKMGAFCSPSLQRSLSCPEPSLYRHQQHSK